MSYKCKVNDKISLEFTKFSVVLESVAMNKKNNICTVLKEHIKTTKYQYTEHSSLSVTVA